ncbi:hypothetical protein L873DRAFT_1803881 [Choiromyces venosus 120613-1]|uniref:Uncharacterized protein n=1 Tax=Choiromyces venosus 120613-1 TaxID=1336337 RepID=A0A3N4JSQ4_9PEZI|nr:hypothetical protein L873DRAFT_1803881 [Choiromyces venosus 120613-1]
MPPQPPPCQSTNQEPHPPASATLLLNTHNPSLYKSPGRSFNPSNPRSTTKFLLSNTLGVHNPLCFVQHVPQHAVAFTLLGRRYTVLSTVRLVVCVCGYLVLHRAFLIYVRNAHMQRLKVVEEQGKLGKEEETVDKNKPIPLDYKSEGEGWGSKARKRQREATKRVEEEAERRNLGEGEGLKSIWISGGIGLLMARLKYYAVG